MSTSSKWLSGMVECSSCFHQWVAVRPAEAVQGLECPKCGNISGMEMVEPFSPHGKNGEAAQAGEGE